MNPSYQYGFIKFRESRVGNPSQYSQLDFYGTGPCFTAGLIFCLPKPEEATKTE